MRAHRCFFLSLLLVFFPLSACADGESVPGIPFELSGYHAFIEVELEGETLSFIFDTGAGGMAINLSTAERLGLQPTARGRITGAADSTQVSWVSELELELGEVRLQGLDAALVPLDHLERGLGRTIDGIVGQDLMHGRLVLLDHSRGIIEVHGPESLDLQTWGEPCRLTRTGPLEIEGVLRLASGDTLEGRFHVDSGAGSYLVVNSDFVRRHRLDQRVGSLYTRRGRALTPTLTQDRIGRVAGVELCGHSFPGPPSSGETPTPAIAETLGVPAILSGASAGVLARRGHGGLIGNAILTRFDLLFDLDRRSLYLRPNALWDGPIRDDASGLNVVLRDDGRIEVDEVIASSPADEAGFEPGDTLRRLDGTDLGTMPLAVLRGRLMEPGKTLRFEIVRKGQPSSLAIRTREQLVSNSTAVGASAPSASTAAPP